MTLKSSGRTPININVHKEQILRTEDIYFAWKRKWSWMIPEYKKLQDELALTEQAKSSKRKDTRTLLPVPKSVNHEYGWVSSKEEFRLNKWGPDVLVYPIKPPEED